MSRLSDLLARLRSLLSARREDRELIEEIRFHIEKEIESNLAAGLSPREARRQAHIKFGGVERMRERTREARGVGVLEELAADLKHALRGMRRAPTFWATAVLTLALCIGANAAIYGVVRNVLLRPLPFEEPSRLVAFYNSYPGVGLERSTNSTADYFLRRNGVDAVEEVALYGGPGVVVGEAGSVARVPALRVTPSLFPVLRVEAAMGRTFLESEMDPAAEPTVVLTREFWRDEMGGAPDAVGRSLRIDGVTTTIVGVLPGGFQLPREEDARLVLPMVIPAAARSLEAWHGNRYSMIGRLAPGATLARASEQVDAVNDAALDDWPVVGGRQRMERAGFHTVVVDARADLVREVRGSLLLLWAGVGFVLLIGCVNVANLIVARMRGRFTEMATRATLGAGQARLARQILVEALVLGILGAAMGSAAGAVALELLRGLDLGSLPRSGDIAMDGSVIAFAALLGVGAALVLGSIPMVGLYRADLGGALRGAGRGGTAGKRAVRLRNTLIIGQVALAFVLLSGAGLMVRSLRAAASVDPGFEPTGVMTGYLSLPPARYPDEARRRALVDGLLAEVRAIPSVAAAGITTQLPFGPVSWYGRVTPENPSTPPGDTRAEPPSSRYSVVSSGYLEALGVEMQEGRTFVESDGPESPNVIVIDRWLAERHWPDRSALGQRMVWGADPAGREISEDDIYTVIGVVEELKFEDLTQAAEDYTGAFYVSSRQAPPSTFMLAVRSRDVAPGVVDAVRAVITTIDPELPLFAVESLEARVGGSLSGRRIPALLLALFAGMGLMLAAVGVYGVLACLVSERRREIGIRVALGGEERAIFGMVMGNGLALVAAGLALGGVATFLLVRLVRSLLFGVEPLDPATLVTSALVLGMAAAAATAIPAHRASRVDPMTALAEG